MNNQFKDYKKNPTVFPKAIKLFQVLNVPSLLKEAEDIRHTERDRAEEREGEAIARCQAKLC